MLVQNWVEMGWPVQIARVQSMPIVRYHSINAIDSWVKDIAIQGKAVRRPLRKGRDTPTKTVKVNHLVSVVVLKDVTNTADSLQVLVAIWVVIVERGGLPRVSIGQGEVDCHRKFDFAATKHILEE